MRVIVGSVVIWTSLLAAGLAADQSVSGTGGPASPGVSINAPAMALPQASTGDVSLFEAESDGGGHAREYRGTVVWTRGTDEDGQPTLVASAALPTLLLSLKLVIRKNTDASLPASHLIEFEFVPGAAFAGGQIAHVRGVLGKNEPLATGTPISGASARVVVNTFIFAASEAEAEPNLALLRDSRYLDVAIVYATGTRAVLSLGKTQAAQQLFTETLQTWAGDYINRPVRTVRIRPDGTIVSE